MVLYMRLLFDDPKDFFGIMKIIPDRRLML